MYLVCLTQMKLIKQFKTPFIMKNNQTRSAAGTTLSIKQNSIFDDADDAQFLTLEFKRKKCSVYSIDCTDGMLYYISTKNSWAIAETIEEASDLCDKIIGKS